MELMINTNILILMFFIRYFLKNERILINKKHKIRNVKTGFFIHPMTLSLERETSQLYSSDDSKSSDEYSVRPLT